MQPGTVDPDYTKWQTDEHGVGVPVLHYRNSAKNAQEQSNPFQRLLISCKFHQYFDQDIRFRVCVRRYQALVFRVWL